MKKWSLIIAGALLLISGDSFGQLLFDPGPPEENYARTGYNRYARSLISRSANPKYDAFGNFLFDGVRIFEWYEEKINSKHVDPAEAYSRIYKINPVDEGEYFREYLNNLVVVNESQKAFSSRFVVGNEVRAKFSPLTLDMAAINGIRWDLNAGLNNITFVSSRTDLPMWFGRDMVNAELINRLMPMYLTGGHIDRKFGVMNVAFNYVNQYKSNSSLSRHKNSITGTLNHNPNEVLMLVVKLEDGSRIDGNGPKLYELFPTINGEKRTDLLVGITKGSWSGDFSDVTRTFDNPAKDLYVNRYYLDPKRIPQYYVFTKAFVENPKGTDYTQFVFKRKAVLDVDDPSYKKPFYKDFSDPIFKNEGKNYLKCDGDEYLQFWFEIPSLTEDIPDVEFLAKVSNDYKFSISEIYNNVLATTLDRTSTYFNVVKEAPGNIQDESNLDWVKFSYGQYTADMVMGIRIDTHVKDFDLIAEFNKNFNFYQYPHNNSKKFRKDAEAYYLNLKRKFGKLTLGTEYFKIDPGYSTTFENVDPAYYAMNVPFLTSWIYELHGDRELQGIATEPDPNKPITTAVSPEAYLSHTMIVNSVDDNDDKDRFPDFHIFSEVRDRNGILPGLDKNGNNRPDTNENNNSVPDYAEPFLQYYVDPDEFDFGEDFNNNGVIDEREDDDRPDYPYEKDTKGYHIFGSYGEELGMKYTLGYINYEQIAGGGKTNARYGKVEYKKFIPFFADIFAATKLKKVEDDIQDNLFRYEKRLGTTLIDSFTYTYNPFFQREGIITDPYYDPLKYRDSYVSRSYLETTIFTIPNLTVNLKFKYDINHQNRNKSIGQIRNDIIERAQVVRVDYKYYFRKLLIMPQVKLMTLKYTNHDNIERGKHEQYFYPILRIEFPLTFKTTFRAGAQGFPGLNSTVRNLMNDQLNFDERHYIIMLSNQSLYNGYDFTMNFGFQMDYRNLHGIMRRSYNVTDRMLFIRLYVGMEPIS